MKYLKTSSSVLILLFSLFISLNAQDSVVLICPNGGEVLEWDSTYTIRWYFEMHPGLVYDISLFLSLDGGISYPYPITGTPNPDTFSMDWVVPHYNSTTCRIQIQVDSSGINIGIDESDSNFTITPTGINESKEKAHIIQDLGFMCFPNPFMISTTISLQGVSDYQNIGLSALHIYDVSGRLAKSIQFKTGTLSLGTDLLPGIYFLKLAIGEHSEIQKLIKIR